MLSIPVQERLGTTALNDTDMQLLIRDNRILVNTNTIQLSSLANN